MSTFFRWFCCLLSREITRGLRTPSLQSNWPRLQDTGRYLSVINFLHFLFQSLERYTITSILSPGPFLFSSSPVFYSYFVNYTHEPSLKTFNQPINDQVSFNSTKTKWTIKKYTYEPFYKKCLPTSNNNYRITLYNCINLFEVLRLYAVFVRQK